MKFNIKNEFKVFTVGMGALAAMIFIGISLAKSPNIINGGSVLSISPYLQTLQPNLHQAIEVNLKNLQKALIQTPQKVSFPIFPVITKKLSPGTVIRRKINLSFLAHPIFIIGSDTLSLKWLTHYAARLKKLQASGYLVQVSDEKTFERIKQIAPNLPIIPVSGNIFAQQLPIHHYPVLISSHLIEQGGLK